MTNTISKAQNNQSVSYTLSFPQPHTHYVEVEMRIDHVNSNELEVILPVWAPGSYLIREFSKNIEGFKAASASGKPLNCNKIRKNAWKIETNGEKNIVARYKIYAFEISVRTSFVDENHAFISPTGVFMYTQEAFNNPVNVSIKPYENWSKISTGLAQSSSDKNTFTAQNFDWLYDSPIEIGNQDVFEFTAAGVLHEVAMVGGGNYDINSLKTDMTKVIEESTSIFGENPNKKYVFIVHNYKNGGGGLEHLNSTVLGAKRMGYNDPVIYANFLGLVAHEYFHLWNVKRLRPAALGPFDYEKENYTTDLWIAEGFTAYYDNLLIKRAHLINEDRYLQLLGEDIQSQMNLGGDKIQPVAEASFDAWIKYYRQNENSSNSQVSYYTKGSLLALILNLEILHQTKGKKSLDDVLKTAYFEFYKEKNIGFTSEEFKGLLEKTAGINLDTFYQDYVYGTTPIDFDKYLGYVGLTLKYIVPMENPSLGIVANKSNIITKVVRDGSAWNSGLNVNDEILAINQQRIEDIPTALENRKIGEKIDVLISRDGILKTITVTLQKDNNNKIQIVKKDRADKDAIKLYNKWLKN
ncbi:M61 family metallopeptidase [Pseudopedobacter saltans]|nr:PDZ domain-containing protein [Pseudopedobacter saltans]